jgi:hypothetical protein
LTNFSWTFDKVRVRRLPQPHGPQGMHMLRQQGGTYPMPRVTRPLMHRLPSAT